MLFRSVSDNIIYIPDIDLNGIDTESVLDDEEIKSVLCCCYTGNDFVKECSGDENLAEDLFCFVDWQHPNIHDVLENYEKDEFEVKFGFSMNEL